MREYRVTILPENRVVVTSDGRNLLELLREVGAAPEADCGGRGKCGKCRVLVNGQEQLACRMEIREDMTVELNRRKKAEIMRETARITATEALTSYAAAVDIGTTTVVAYLLDGKTGEDRTCASTLNPQKSYGGDVISRVQAAEEGHLEELQRLIDACVNKLLEDCCAQAGIEPTQVGRIAVAANPAMQQLFLGLSCENLAKLPFVPAVTETRRLSAGALLPAFSQAELLVLPAISGYVGGDTVACILSESLREVKDTVLLVDIGTNGELVLAAGGKLWTCSCAAGPALEGANIRFGMRAAVGAVNAVKASDGVLSCQVIGEGKAVGLCGSGLIDAVAAALALEKMDYHGRLAPGEEREGQRTLSLADSVWLGQDDVRQLQLAKGAIAAGCEILTEAAGLSLDDVDRVLLAGAFGSFLNPDSACAIGLLPPSLQGKISSVGNAAGAGARMLALSENAVALADGIAKETEFVELAAQPDFEYIFAENMLFPHEAEDD